MSALITVVDDNTSGVLLAADNRSLNFDGTINNNKTKKVFKINDKVFFGISGLTEEGLRLHSLLIKNKDLPASELICIARDFEVKNVKFKGKVHGAVFVLAGAYDDGEAFIWSRSTYPEIESKTTAKHIDGLLGDADPGSLVKGTAAIQISCPNESSANFIRSNFIPYLIEAKGNYAQMLALCIANAAERDTSISSSMDILTLDTQTMKIQSGSYIMAR